MDYYMEKILEFVFQKRYIFEIRLANSFENIDLKI